MKKLKTLYHRMRGREEAYQLYVNIIYSTSEDCMEYHGEIFLDQEEVPSVTDCKIEVLTFPIDELGFYREKKGRMKQKVEKELTRRDLFQQAEELVEKENYEEAIDRFETSVKLDVFLPEVEDFCANYQEQIPDEVSAKLKKVFVVGYKDKFGQKRYERFPERMREARKKAGVKRIRELFA